MGLLSGPLFKEELPTAHTHTHLDVANKRRTAHCTRARTHTWISPSRVLIITFAAILGGLGSRLRRQKKQAPAQAELLI